jgi:hypothetical protein
MIPQDGTDHTTFKRKGEKCRVASVQSGTGFGPAGYLNGPVGDHNSTDIEACCGYLPPLFESMMRLGLPTLEQVMYQPCASHDPLEDDDLNMDDDAIDQGVVD